MTEATAAKCFRCGGTGVIEATPMSCGVRCVDECPVCGAAAEIERLQARVREVEAAHEETAAKLNSYVCLAGSQMDEIAAGKARVQELEAVAAQAQRALKPFANCVYNDNGAHTITDMYTLTAGNCSDAFLAEKRLRAVLQSPALSKETT